MKVMRTTTWLTLVSAVLLISTYPLSSTAQSTKNFDQKCLALKTCLKGGVPANPCTITNERCPPCITFNDNGCFELDPTSGKCPFGDDCSPYFPMNGGTATTTSTPTAATSGTDPSSSTASTTVITTPGPTNETTTKEKSSSSSGGQMSVVLGIIGAAIGVIAVGIIFMVLVRRSRAEDDEEEITTPIGKRGYRTTSGPTPSTSATYVSYGQPPPPSSSSTYPTTPTHQVHQYYNDHAQPSPRHGRTPSQPQVAKTVRPVASVNAPTFFNKGPSVSTSMRSSISQPPSHIVITPSIQDLHLDDLQSESSFSERILKQEETESQLHRRVSSPRSRDSYEF